MDKTKSKLLSMILMFISLPSLATAQSPSLSSAETLRIKCYDEGGFMAAAWLCMEEVTAKNRKVLRQTELLMLDKLKEPALKAKLLRANQIFTHYRDAQARYNWQLAAGSAGTTGGMYFYSMETALNQYRIKQLRNISTASQQVLGLVYLRKQCYNKASWHSCLTKRQAVSQATLSQKENNIASFLDIYFHDHESSEKGLGKRFAKEARQSLRLANQYFIFYRQAECDLFASFGKDHQASRLACEITLNEQRIQHFRIRAPIELQPNPQQ